MLKVSINNFKYLVFHWKIDKNDKKQSLKLKVDVMRAESLPLPFTSISIIHLNWLEFISYSLLTLNKIRAILLLPNLKHGFHRYDKRSNKTFTHSDIQEFFWHSLTQTLIEIKKKSIQKMSQKNKI